MQGFHVRKQSVVSIKEDLRLNAGNVSRLNYGQDSHLDLEIQQSYSQADPIGNRLMAQRKTKKVTLLKTPMLLRQATKRNSSQPKGTIISHNSHKRRGSLLQEFQDILKPPSVLSLSSSSDDSFKNNVKRDKDRFSSKLIPDKISAKKNTVISNMVLSQKILDTQQSNKRLQSVQSVLKENMLGSKRNIRLKDSLSTVQKMGTLSRQQSNVSKMSRYQQKSNGVMEASMNRKSSNILESQLHSTLKNQVSSRSILMVASQKNKDQILEILENNPLFSEAEKKKYLEMLELLENSVQTDDQSKRARMQRKVRKTFVQMVNRLHQNEQPHSPQSKQDDSIQNQSQHFVIQESQFLQDNMSIFSDFSIHRRNSQDLQIKKNGQISEMSQTQQMLVRHYAADSKLTEIKALEHNFTKEQEQLQNANRIQKMMEFYIQEMNVQDDDDESLQESEFAGEEDFDMLSSSDYSQKDPTHVIMRKEIKQHTQKISRNPYTDFYPLFLKNEHGFQSLKNDFQIYTDGYPLLTLRKLIVYLIGFCNQVSFKIITHKSFVFISLIIILINIYLFALEHLQMNNNEQLDKIYQYKQELLYFYFCENFLKISGLGVVKFTQNLWNVYDLFLLVMYAFYIGDYIPYDVSSFRLIRILLFLGLFIKPLNIMLISLSQAFNFLLEALMIMIILGVFFALQGMHLFSGLVRNICLIEENGLFGEQRFCGYVSCPTGQYCGAYANNPQVPSNFDNFGFAWGQVMRVILFNEWHEPMYENMQTFHPVSFVLFILIIFYGIFGSNLIIAVLKIYYSETMEKAEKEEIEQPEDLKYQGAEVNLMVLKQYGLYDQLQKTLKVYIDRHIKKRVINSKTFQLSEKLNQASPRSEDVGNQFGSQDPTPRDYSQMKDIIEENFDNTKTLTRKKIQARKSTYKLKKKMRPYLSARQNRLYQAQQDQLKGIETVVNDTHWLVNFIENISLQKILLPRRTLQELYFKTISENDEVNLDEQCIPILYKLKNNEFLAWKVKVKHPSYLDYVSTSEIDVLSQINKVKKKEDKRMREFEFISKSNPQHFYIISKKEIFKAQKTQQHEYNLTKTRQKRYRRSHFPISHGSRNRQKTIKQLTMAGRSTCVQVMESSRAPRGRQQSQFQYNDQQSYYKSDSQRSKFEKITLNGIEYDYEDLRKMIERPIGKENDEILDDNLVEELYVNYRKEEAQQNFVLKNNWSAEDVIQDHFGVQRKVFIFKSLNRIDKIIWINGFGGLYQVIQKYTIKTMRLRGVEIFFDFCILTNIGVLVLDGLIPLEVSTTINDIVTILLGIELFMKLISQNLKKFLSKKVNLIECIIVLSCLSEIIISQMMDVDYISPAFDLFLQLTRGFKAILFYRIIQYNKFALRMAYITEKTFPLFCNLIVLMFFIVSIFAFFGIELFKDKFPQNEQLGQLHQYDDLFKAWMSTFLIGTNDDWYGVVLLGTTYSDTWVTIIYQTLLLYILNFMTFGLFIAIILDGFSKYLTRENDELEVNHDPYHMNTEVSEDIKDILNDGLSLNSAQSQSRSNTDNDHEYTKLQNLNNDNEDNHHEQTGITYAPSQNLVKEEQKDKYFDVQLTIDQLAQRILKEFIFYENEDCQDSLFLFSKKNSFRKFCYSLVMDYRFQMFTNLTLFISLINMTVYTYYDHDEVDQHSQIISIISVIELILNTIVFGDLILKIISFGFFLEKGSFSSELWRTLDFIYVSTFLLNEIITIEVNLFFLFNYLKYIRPMRFINLHKGVKEVKDALAESLPDLINVLAVQMLVWLIFAIFGVILYKGKLGFCDESMNFGVGIHQCQEEQGEWIIYVHNFENILQAISSLYIICTLDLWGPIFQICYNSASQTTGPLPFANQWATYIFFFLFILIGAFFFLGFFTGILFIYFQENRAKMMNAELNDDQTLFLQISAQIMIEEPQYSDPPKSFIRLTASKIIDNKYYQASTPPLLVINIAVLASFYHGQSYDYFSTLNIIHHSLACVLILDSCLKLTAYGFVRYFGLGWRRFEFILSIFSLADLILDRTIHWSDMYYSQTVNTKYFISLRLLFFLRDFRVLLIIQQFQGLSRLMRILAFSMPYLLRILSLFFSILLIYAYAGCQLFGKIDKGEIMDEYLNFHNLFLAILTLFKCSTRNNWRHIMVDCTSHNPYCAKDPHQCGQTMLISQLYFYTFILISSLIVFQLFVLALVEQLEGFYNSQNNVIQTYIENIDKFRTIWCQYSYETKGKKMHTKSLAHFLLQLGDPLGSLKGDNIWDVAKDAANFHIKSDSNGYVHFQEVLYETIRFVYKEQVFRSGSKEGIMQMKKHDKNIRFRLHHRRLDLSKKRTPVQPKLYLTSNFNIMQEYIYVLQVFRAWYSYSNKLIQNAVSKKQQGFLFDESVDVSFHGKDVSSSDSEDERKIYYEILQNVLNTVHYVSDEEDKNQLQPKLTIEKYIFHKNPNRKQKVRLQFNDHVDQIHDEDYIFEPAECIRFENIPNQQSSFLFSIDHQQQGSNFNVKTKKSNLKQVNDKRKSNNFQVAADSTSLLMINAGGDPLFQNYGSSQHPYTLQVKTIPQLIPNPMDNFMESESDISRVIDPDYSVNQILDDEAEIKQIQDTVHQFTGKPNFNTVKSDDSNQSDQDIVRTETYKSLKLKHYNIRNLKQQQGNQREPKQNSPLKTIGGYVFSQFK